MITEDTTMNRWDHFDRKEIVGEIGPVPVVLSAAPRGYVPPNFDVSLPVRPKADFLRDDERSSGGAYGRPRRRGEVW